MPPVIGARTFRLLNSRTGFAALLTVGVLARAAVITLPGTGDVGVYKMWAYNGTIDSPARLYGVGGSPTERRELKFPGVSGPVTYPPLVIDELAVAGRIYDAAAHHDFRDGPGLTIAIKSMIVAADVGFVLLAFVFVRRHADVAAARWAAIAYWLNPAMILAGAVLGYLDALYVVPAAAALFAAAGGWPFLGGALIALAAFTKPQAVVLVPAVALAAARSEALRTNLVSIGRAALGGLITSMIVLAPIIAIGALPNLVLAMSRLAQHDMLSANACNLWWIVDYVLRVVYSVRDIGIARALTIQTRILGISRVVELGYPNVRIVGTLLTLAAAAWTMWIARRVRDWFLLSAVAAFLMHAYMTLAAQVHENHLFAAVPLLAIAAAGRPVLRPYLWAISGIFALNLYLFYGIGEYQFRGRYMLPRNITGIDATVLLALFNCVVFVKYALALAHECRLDARPGEQAGGGSAVPL